MAGKAGWTVGKYGCWGRLDSRQRWPLKRLDCRQRWPLKRLYCRQRWPLKRLYCRQNSYLPDFVWCVCTQQSMLIMHKWQRKNHFSICYQYSAQTVALQGPLYLLPLSEINIAMITSTYLKTANHDKTLWQTGSWIIHFSLSDAPNFQRHQARENWVSVFLVIHIQ